MVIISIGARKTGKTTFAVELAKFFLGKKSIRETVVNDVQREHKYRNTKGIRCFYGDKDAYLDEIAKYNYKGSFRLFIVEEAVKILQHGSNNERAVDAVLSCRFNGNIFILNFHSLRQVPDYLLDYTDKFYIRKSRGNVNRLSIKYENYPEVLKAWQKANASTNRFEAIKVDL